MAVRKKARRYDATRRQAAAGETRRAIVDAARRIFLKRGYLATTMAAIARAAGVAVDTIYASIGNKPALFRLLIELSISGSDQPILAVDRDYVRAIQSERDVAKKLTIYAHAVRAIQERLAPLFAVLQSAAALDRDLGALWRELSERRAANMLQFAGELKKTGGLRPDLTAQEVADILWSTNSSELYLLLVQQRGWPPERFERWLADAWRRLLLAPA